MDAPTGLKVARYYPRPGAATYTWDVPVGTPSDLEYKVFRGGALVRTSPASLINGNDSGLWYPESYEVTLTAGDSVPCAPITVQLPSAAQALPGGEILYLRMAFADAPHPDTTDPVPLVQQGCDWITRVSAGLMRWTPTIQDFTMSGPMADYQLQWFPTYLDTLKVMAEITDRLGLKARTGLWRVVMDFTGFQFKANVGQPMWPEADNISSDNYGSGVWGTKSNYQNFLHEILHSCGLGHYGFLPSLPVNPDDLSGTSPGARSDELMGSNQLAQVTIDGVDVPSLSLLNMVMLGIRKPEQIAVIKDWGGSYTISRNDLADGSMQGVRIPLTPAGSSYVVEYRAPYVRVVLRPATGGVQGLTLFEVGTGLWPGLLFSDIVHGITVNILARDATSVSVEVKTPVPPPPPPPPPRPEVVSVSILTPVAGSTVPAGSSISLHAETEPVGLPVKWKASKGTISGSTWTAPGRRNTQCIITATTTDGMQTASTSEVVMTNGSSPHKG